MTFARKTLFAATALLAIAFGFAPTANAGPIHDLPSCYTHVITICNATSKHPDECASNATKACDEEFGNKGAAGALPGMNLAPQRSSGIQLGLLLPAVQSAREAARR